MAAGYSVKLEHDSKETTWEEHGDITIKLPDGKELNFPKYQHNRAWTNGSAKKAMEQIPKL